MRKYILGLILASLILGCSPKIKLFQDATDPLKEFTISGTGGSKVLLVPIRGVISDETKRGIITKASMVQEVVSQLRLAEKDEQVKAVVLKINSPGGSVTASDILYHELTAFKKRTGIKLVAAMMGLAASGGYYISLPADYILAHPTTITGSVGVIMLMPKIDGLLDKIGVGVDIHKYGKNKDMASPFRPATREERDLLQDITNEFGNRFIGLVKTHRNLDSNATDLISTGRVFVSREAKTIGLVDEVGYLSDAILRAKKLSGLSEDARVVVYRRTEYADDNIYNTAISRTGNLEVSLVNFNLPGTASSMDPGFYYLWLPAVSDD